jgi:protein-glutamine gamma-glutamyltransferase
MQMTDAGTGSAKRPPPLLLGAALLFWGWQTGYLPAAAAMAVIIESPRFIKTRWEFSDSDFGRIWTLCALVFLAAAVYAFTDNEGPANFSTFFKRPNFFTERTAGISGTRTASELIKWLPMIFFLFVAAQAFSAREEIPLETISQILRWRWRKAGKTAGPLPASPGLNISYLYFAVCLLAASAHPGDGNVYFWGFCSLLAAALWWRRSRRYGFIIWSCALGMAIVLSFFGQRGVSDLQGYIESLNLPWLRQMAPRGTNPERSRTSLGKIGRLQGSGKIVIRLEPKNGGAAPSLLREASYRIYKGPVWDAGSSSSDFEDYLGEKTNSTTWVLLSGKTNTARVNIACFLEGRAQSGNPAALLPLPGGCSRLENLPAYVLHTNSAGAVLAEGPGLVLFDAFYGPGATIDSPPDPNEDLNVPRDETNALDRVISELHFTGQTLEQTNRAINELFESKFTYSTWQSRHRLEPNESELSYFLLSSRSGHCEYFATATVLLLRRLHIPARYAVGYAVHESSGSKYVVRERDGHAWCLVWNGKTWEDLDTTPPSWIEAESKRMSPFQSLSDFWSRLKFEFSKLRWGQSAFRKYLFFSLIPVLGLLFYQILRRSRRQRRRHEKKSAAATWPGLDSEFYQLEKKLASRSVERRPSEPLSGWLQRATNDVVLVQMKDPLHELLRLHYRYRFDPRGLDTSDREELKRGTQMFLGNLDKTQKSRHRDTN